MKMFGIAAVTASAVVASSAHAGVVQYIATGSITTDNGDVPGFFTGFSVGDAVEFLFEVNETPVSVIGAETIIDISSVTISVTTGAGTTTRTFDSITSSPNNQPQFFVDSNTHAVEWSNLNQDGLTFGMSLSESFAPFPFGPGGTPDTSLNGYVPGTLPTVIDPATFDFNRLRFVDSATGSAGFFASADTVTFVPAPGVAAVLGLGGLVAVRRRR